MSIPQAIPSVQPVPGLSARGGSGNQPFGFSIPNLWLPTRKRHGSVGLHRKL
jgi:hypothetical protein